MVSMNIPERRDAVVVMNIRSNETLSLLLGAQSRLSHEFGPEILNCPHNHLIKRYHNESNIIALLGIIRFITFKSPSTGRFTVINVSYKWLNIDTTSIEEPSNCRGSGMYILLKSHRTDRAMRQKRLITTVRGEFHCYKFCHCACYVGKCKRILYAWNQAEALCKKEGLSLPTILSRTEQEDLISTLKISLFAFHRGPIYIYASVSST